MFSIAPPKTPGMACRLHIPLDEESYIEIELNPEASEALGLCMVGMAEAAVKEKTAAKVIRRKGHH